jgi:plastocyanin
MLSMIKSPLMRALCTAGLTGVLWGGDARAQEHVDVRLHLVQQLHSSPHSSRAAHPAPAVAWLTPIGVHELPVSHHDPYVLLQKNRMFTPHLLVVPVGSVVLFPNADPYFHNVFSLFDGKRFDLGLYEAGSTKAVTFSREGLSYIFCNIHPEMSAVVISLSTPFYAIASPDGEINLHDVPSGEYDLHVWVEGETQPVIDKVNRRIHLGSSKVDLGEVMLAAPSDPGNRHENKFGQSYDQSAKPVY